MVKNIAEIKSQLAQEVEEVKTPRNPSVPYDQFILAWEGFKEDENGQIVPIEGLQGPNVCVEDVADYLEMPISNCYTRAYQIRNEKNAKTHYPLRELHKRDSGRASVNRITEIKQKIDAFKKGGKVQPKRR